MFAQADLKIVEAKYVIIPPERTEFAESWSRLSGTVQDTLKSSAHAHVYQVVVKAVPLSYTGDPVPLAPPKPRQTVATSFAFLKMRIGRCLPPQVKKGIRKGLDLLGIRL